MCGVTAICHAILHPHLGCYGDKSGVFGCVPDIVSRRVCLTVPYVGDNVVRSPSLSSDMVYKTDKWQRLGWFSLSMW